MVVNNIQIYRHLNHKLEVLISKAHLMVICCNHTLPEYFPGSGISSWRILILQQHI